MLRSIFSNWFGMFVSGLVGIALTPLMINHLGEVYFGLWILTTSAFDYSGLLETGMRSGMFRFIARAAGSGDRRELDKILSISLALAAGLSAVVLIVLPGLMMFLPPFFRLAGHEAHVFRVALLLIGVGTAVACPARTVGSYMSGVRRFDLYNVSAVSTVVIRGIAIAVLLLRGYGLIAASVAFLVAAIFNSIVSWYLLRRADPAAQFRRDLIDRRGVNEVLGFGIFAFLFSCGDTLRAYTDSIVIGRLLGVVLVPIFNIAGRLMEYWRQVMNGVFGPLAGRLSEYEGQGDYSAMRSYLVANARYFTLASLMISILLTLDGRALIVRWVGIQFNPSYKLMLILLVGWMVEFAWVPGQLLLLARARHKYLAYLTLSEGMANLVLSILWGRRYGLVGIAYGTTIPMIVCRALVLPPYVFKVAAIHWRDYFRATTVKPCLAAAAGAAICLLPGFPRVEAVLGRILWVGMLQSLVLTAMALAIALDAGERRAVWSLVRRLKPTGRPADAAVSR